MAKYKLKSLSVQIGGKVHKKEDKTVFDTEKKFKSLKSEVEKAEKAGFLVKLKEEKKTSKKDKK